MMQFFPLQNPLSKTSYSELPSTAGIYLFKKGKTYLYIGKSVNIKARVLSHVENSAQDTKEYAIVSQSDSIETQITDSEFKALLLESELIQIHHPKYNVIWRDGKSHLYIKITEEKYPKIYAVRKEDDNKSLYFGPFSSTRDVESLLRTIRRIIPFCSQKKITKRPCFYHKIGLCDPCPNDIGSRGKEYRRNIRRIVSLLLGKTGILLNSMNRDLKVAIKSELYEDGLRIRNRIQTLKYLIQNRSFERYGEHDFNNSEESLQALFSLISPYFPQIPNLKRIECYDISNLSQKQGTGSMVVLTGGLIDKNQYRRFKIKNLKIQSDFDMLDEVITRRFKNKCETPSLIIVDGGKPQVRRIMQVTEKMGVSVPILGIAKGPDRFILGVKGMPTINPRSNNLGYRLVQLIRDESHRFARKYHLFLRDREMI
ncbi:GIY-YIG nuclease family protein [Candidatus Roizmanbacteria bacterium]|nr:GIY-YIG nuclease family protein [Candidatus Roizmanbacteria bacterium]